jgi:integrase/recombinase XerD
MGIDGDFTACDAAMLNRFFADYRKAHTQGGTNTRQRNLHHLLHLAGKAYGHPDPWNGGLVRYGPGKNRPSTLAEEFIRDLLVVTGGGRATSFEDARDHAIICVLAEGVRRTDSLILPGALAYRRDELRAATARQGVHSGS